MLVHIPSEFIGACLPDRLGGLQGDKAVSVVFDNTKIKRFVPGLLRHHCSYAEGIRRTLAWFDADPGAADRRRRQRTLGQDDRGVRARRRCGGSLVSNVRRSIVGQVGNLRGGCLPPPFFCQRAGWLIDNRPQVGNLPHKVTSA